MSVEHGRRCCRRVSSLAGAGIVGTVAAVGTASFVQPASASAATHFTGAPIVVATESLVGSSFGNFPQVFAGVNAAARAINKAGGIHGHQVKVMTCNGQANPNQEVACATSAVSAGAVAMVGNLVGLNGTGVDNALIAGQTAELAAQPFYPSQFNAQIGFPLFFSNGETSVCTSKAMSKAIGATAKDALVTNPAASLPALQAVAKGSAAANGTQFVGTILPGFTTTDFAPIVAQTAALHPNVVTAAVAPQLIGPFVTAAVGGGETWATCVSDGAIAPSTVLQLGAAFTKFYEGAGYPPLSAVSQYPGLKAFIAQMHAQQAAGDPAASLSVDNYFSEALNGWLGMQVLDQVATSMKGPINHSTFLAALSHAKVNLHGIIPNIDFSKPIGNAAFPHVFNAKQYLIHWVPAKKTFVLLGVTTQNSFQYFEQGSA